MFGEKARRIAALEAQLASAEETVRDSSTYKMGLEVEAATAQALLNGTDEADAFSEVVARHVNERADREGAQRARVYISGHKQEIDQQVEPIAEALALDGLRKWQESGEAAKYREKITKELTGRRSDEVIAAARKQIRDEVKASEVGKRIATERAAEARSQRLKELRKLTAKTGIVEFKALQEDDVLAVIFSSPRSPGRPRDMVRRLVLKLINPAEGLCEVEQDSWHEGQNVHLRKLGLRGGLRLTVRADNPYTDKHDPEPLIVSEQKLDLASPDYKITCRDDDVVWQVRIGDVALIDDLRGSYQ